MILEKNKIWTLWLEISKSHDWSSWQRFYWNWFSSLNKILKILKTNDSTLLSHTDLWPHLVTLRKNIPGYSSAPMDLYNVIYKDVAWTVLCFDVVYDVLAKNGIAKCCACDESVYSERLINNVLNLLIWLY